MDNNIIQRLKYKESVVKLSYKYGVINTAINKKALLSEEDLLKERLIEFRKTKSKENGIPAYYIFNNEELDKLIKLKSKTIKEIRKNKIITDVKVNTHGKELIKIINN